VQPCLSVDSTKKIKWIRRRMREHGYHAQIMGEIKDCWSCRGSIIYEHSGFYCLKRKQFFDKDQVRFCLLYENYLGFDKNELYEFRPD